MIEQTQREIALLREYRTRLIADVVTGKLDVRGVEIPDVEGAVEDAVAADELAVADEVLAYAGE